MPTTSNRRFAGDLRALVERSIAVIAEHQDVGGAYPASPTFRVYRYSWLRDGAFIADAMSRASEVDSADRFWAWCARVIEARSDTIRRLVDRSSLGDQIDPDEFLPTRYTLDGAPVEGEEWWDFQLDGYGTWMWGLAEHVRRHPTAAGLVERTAEAVRLSTRYLIELWPRPCYDWWEEQVELVHPATLSCIEAGLRAAIELGVLDPGLERAAAATVDAIHVAILRDGVRDGQLVKSFGRTDVDANLVACFTPFGTIHPTSEIADATYERIVADLAPDGVHRYRLDTYFGGGRWVVLAGLLGWHEAVTGRTERAMARLRWMHGQATADGLLPEQVPELALWPEMVAPWEEQWGTVATPLLWSHAMYITLADALGLLDEGTA